MVVQFPPLREIFGEGFEHIFTDKSRYLIEYGGRGSGKSTRAAKKLIIRCLQEPYFRQILLRKTYASIKDSQYQTIKDIITDWGLQELFEFKKAPLEIVCKNGNKFIARGLDKEDTTKSIKDPTGIWYEEANQIKKADFMASTTSIRTTKAAYIQEIITFNPECEGDPKEFWIYKHFFEGHNEMSFKGIKRIKYDGEEIEYKYSVTHSTHKDNKHLPKEYRAQLEDLRNTDPYYYDVYTLGQWGMKKIESPFMSLYDPSKHEAPVQFNPKEAVILVVDFNLDPFCVNFAHEWTDHNGDHCHIFDEISVSNGSIPKLADEIKSRYGKYLYSFEVTGDKSGGNRTLAKENLSYFQQLASELNISEVQFRLPRNPTHKESKSHCNYVLYHHPDFKINPDNCPNTIRDMRVVQYENNKIVKSNRAITGQQADHLDNVRYLINTYLKRYKYGDF